MRRIIEILIISTLMVLFFSCQQKSEYRKMLEKELATGIRQDTLFYGIYLGMPSKDFYAHCWEMNKKGWIRQGDGNTSVYAKITELGDPASMNFYPSFYEDKIIEMPADFAYDAWAPWNKKLSADSLQIRVKGLMEEWHGKGFIEVKGPNRFVSPIAFTKIDGNRRILIYKVDESKVRVEFTDMVAKEKMDKMEALAEKK